MNKSTNDTTNNSYISNNTNNNNSNNNINSCNEINNPNFDLRKFFAWAKSHAAAERKAKHWLPTGPKALEASGGTTKSPATRKSHVRRSGFSA